MSHGSASKPSVPRRRTLLAAGAAVAVVGTGLALAIPRRPDKVRIGVGQPLSGALAALGQDMLNGATMAADEINAGGGISLGSGRLPLEIVSGDDEANAERGRIVAADLVAADVVAVIAHLNSGVSIAAAPIYAQAGVPQLAISTKPEYTQLGLPTTLRLVVNDDTQARAVGSFAATLPGAQRFAVADDGTPYGASLAKGSARVLAEQGKQVVLQRTLDDKTTSFDELVAALAGAGAQVLVTTLADFQVQALMQQMAAAGLAGMQIVGPDTVKTERTITQEPPIRALYATSPIIPPEELPSAARFLDEYRRRFGAAPFYAGHYAYDAVMLVADALRRNRSLDKAELLQRLKTFDGNAPVVGMLRMTEQGEQRHGSVGVYRARQARWELQMRASNW